MWQVRCILLLTLVGTLWLLLRYVPFELPSYAFYTAVITALAALIAIFRPLPVIWLPNRPAAAIALVAAAAVAVTSLLWPSKSQRSTDTGTLLDRTLPEYEHREFHSIGVTATVEESWRAIKDVTFADVPAFRILMRIRMAAAGDFSPTGTRGTGSILSGLASPGSGFFVLGEIPGEEIILGMVGRPWASEPGVLAMPQDFATYAAPRSVRIAFNLRVIPEGGGARISTETRIQGTDESGTKTFAPYWRAVYPGSSIMRQAWLEAIALRAAAGTT